MNLYSTMGQYFRFSAPRAKRALDLYGKLGEILFDTSPAEIVRHLVVPFNPAHRSPPSSAIPPEPQAVRDDLDAAHPTEPQIVSRSLVAMPVDAVSPQQQQVGSKANENPSDTFSMLPLEIHELIFSYLDYLPDIVCLGIASPRLWDITYRTLLEQYSSHFGSWAGDNIVCAGDESDPGDYPFGLFSVEEEENLNRGLLIPVYNSNGYHNEDYDSAEDGNDDAEPFTIYSLAYRWDTRVYEDVFIYGISRRVFEECLQRSKDQTRKMKGQSLYSAISSKSSDICAK